MDDLDHLDLPTAESSFERKKHGGGGYKINNRNYGEFYQEQIQKLDSISKKFERENKTLVSRFESKPEPELIFKIKTFENQSINDETFREQLKGAGLRIISSATAKKGYWVGATEDPTFNKYKEKLKARIERTKENFIDAIEEVNEIPRENKIGALLQESPIQDIEVARLDVSLWKDEDDSENSKVNQAMTTMAKIVSENGGDIHDKLITKNLCLLRISANKKLVDELLKLQSISTIDRPPRLRLEKITVSDKVEEFEMDSPPSDAHGILIMDSGIRSGHPLLKDAVKDEIAKGMSNKKIIDGKTFDENGHGTEVAGIALHGNIEQCIHSKKFEPEVWIYSAKIMYENEEGDVVFDEDKLIEHQLKDSLEEIIQKYPKCKVINLSIGNDKNKMEIGQAQFNLAALIDELSYDHKNIVFVISAGNLDRTVYHDKTYPNYLLDEDKEVKIIDPATSAHAISVGAIVHRDGNWFPSSMTRVGPGLNGMIKPDLVEHGGGFDDEIMTINPRWVKEARLFTLVKGTSYSAPMVSHYLAKLMNRFPNASRNLIKALLLSSAEIPVPPEPIPKIKSDSTVDDVMKILNIYGNGKPNFIHASYSDDNRVVFIHDGEIQVGHARYFPIVLPDEFINETGEREISVSLVFDPPIRKTRSDYLGVFMEYHLYRNKPIGDIVEAYKKVDLVEGEEEKVPEILSSEKIDLKPGVRVRKKGVHQKALKKFKDQFELDATNPLVLVVIAQKRWINDDTYKQRFSVVVTIKHSAKIDLYNKIRIKNKIRARVR